MSVLRSAALSAALAASSVLVTAGSAAAASSEVHLRAGAEPAAGAVTTWAYGRYGDQHLLCDWDGDGDATLGLYRASDATWYVRQSAGGGTADLAFRYGRPGAGDRVLCGDWNGDGIDTPGLFRSSDNTWHLRNTVSGGAADTSFRYGRPGAGDVPLAGDWNGDRVDTPGIFRSSDSLWYLRDSSTAGNADRTFRYGRPSAADTPLVGDWDGNGTDTPGIFRAADATMHLRNSSTAGPADWTYPYASRTDKPLAGDWDGDGADEPAVSRQLAPAPPPPGNTYSAALRTAVRQLPVTAEDNAGYDRDRYFGSSWIDADRDCQNTRHEVLIAESTVTPTYSSSRCTVTAGRWPTFYDGKTYTLPSQVQIDHLVPVAEAWGSGARTWTQQRRVAFYNDLGVGYALNAMASSLNQSKGARGPEQWMPPANHCRYIEVWTAVKHRWRLSVDSSERAALIRHADACPNDVLTVPRA